MQAEWKRRAASKAAELVEPGMTVALGSGTTMEEVVRFLAERDVEASFIPSSSRIEDLARSLRLRLVSLSAEPDLAIDGADEVDPSLNMIKGRGGALTREKILARAARRVVIVVDRTKLVRRLGERVPVPVEVLPFSFRFTSRLIERMGGTPELRMKGKKPYVTDNGNYILDVRFGRLSSPRLMEKKLNELPGVVENGIFTGLADLLIVGHEGGVDVVASRRSFLGLLRRFGKL